MTEVTTEKKQRVLVTRRLYSLYPEQIMKLETMAKARSIPQSQFLRELLDVAFVSYLQAQQRYTNA